jgi:hypothetical protein
MKGMILMDMNTVAARMGLTQQDAALDTLTRSNYASDDAYIDACVAFELKRSDPEYRATRSRIAAQYRERQEAAQKAESEAAYRQIRSNVELDHLTTRQIDQEAAEMARRDLAAGRIFASDMGKAIEKYAAQLVERAKDSKASGQLFNSMLRSNR